jgi:hypothetical protein
MLASSSARRIGLATVAVLACTSALVPSAASAKPKAKASQDAGSASSTPQVSGAALAAGRKKFGADVTPQQAISAYWTPERMREAKPIDEAPFLDAAAKKFETLDAVRQKKAGLDAAKGLRPKTQGAENTVPPVTGELAKAKPKAAAPESGPSAVAEEAAAAAPADVEAAAPTPEPEAPAADVTADDKTETKEEK